MTALTEDIKSVSCKIIAFIPNANKLLEKLLFEVFLTRKKNTQLAKYPLVLRVKPLNKVYIIILSLSPA